MTLSQKIRSAMRTWYWRSSTLRRLFWLYCACIDAMNYLFGRRSESTPPRRHSILICGIGSGVNRRESGKEFLRCLIELGGLRPHHHVLDVGCGTGRVAMALTRYLKEGGTYEGFDIVPVYIDWCQKAISSEYPHFQFQLADIVSLAYNPKGRYQGATYVFPYEDGTFDFVFLSSVFTHLLPAEMENYLGQIGRVLDKGGRCLITFFLLNDESLQCIDAKKSDLDFRYDYGAYRVIDRATPEADVAYDESFILRLYEKVGLKIAYPIYYGSWCGRSRFSSYQDIVVASKT